MQPSRRLVIRSYRAADAGAVIALWNEVFPSSRPWHTPAGDIRRKLRVQRDLFLVGESDKTVIATAMAGYDGHRGWIYRVAVAPAHRRRGVGHAMVVEALGRLQRRGCPKVNLQILGSNRAVVAFYERLGFTVEERISMGKPLEGEPRIPSFPRRRGSRQLRDAIGLAWISAFAGMTEYVWPLMRHILLLLCVLCVSAVKINPATAAHVAARPSSGCSAATLATGWRLERSIDVAGTARTYIIDAPSSLRPGQPVPLMFDFHGFGHSAGGVWRVSRFRELAERDPFIAVYPDGIPVRFSHQRRDYHGPGWDIRTRDGNRDLTFVTLMLERLEREYCIDRARVFSTGFSNGAFFSHLLACTMADRFAAIAPVSGGRRPDPCVPARAVPVLIFHGRQDDRIDVVDARAARDAWVATNQCREPTNSTCERFTACRDGATVEYCEGDFAHRWPAPSTARIWEFFKVHPMWTAEGEGR